jgi:hypothetical protein
LTQLPEQQSELVVQLGSASRQKLSRIGSVWHLPVLELHEPEQHSSPIAQAKPLALQLSHFPLAVLQRIEVLQQAWRAVSQASPAPLHTHLPPEHSRPVQHSLLEPHTVPAVLQAAQLLPSQ